MTADPVTVESGASVREVVNAIIEKRFSGVPVVDDGELVGLVEVMDLLPHPGNVPFSDVDVLEFQGEWLEEDGDLDEFLESLDDVKVRDVMRTEVPTVRSDATVGEILRRLVDEDCRRLLVLDDDGKLMGVVTRKDLLDAFYRWS